MPYIPYLPYIPNIPYFPNMPYQTDHTHHTYPTYHTTPPPHHRGGEGEDLIWGQYMGPIPWGWGGGGGWQGLVHIYIYILNVYIYIYIILYVLYIAKIVYTHTYVRACLQCYCMGAWLPLTPHPSCRPWWAISRSGMCTAPPPSRAGIDFSLRWCAGERWKMLEELKTATGDGRFECLRKKYCG